MSINRLEFETSLTLLEENYSNDEKQFNYTNAQKDTLWKRYKTLNAVTWNKMIDVLRDYGNFLPRPHAFKKVLESLGTSDPARQVRYMNEECLACDGLGLQCGIFRHSERKKHIYRAVARCSCANGENWSTQIATVAAVERNENSGLIEFTTMALVDQKMDMHIGLIKNETETITPLESDTVGEREPGEEG